MNKASKLVSLTDSDKHHVMELLGLGDLKYTFVNA